MRLTQIGLRKLIILTLIFSASSSSAAEPAHLKPEHGNLNVSNMVLTFEDDFHVSSVVPRGPLSNYSNAIKWTAHTPWNGDFGDALFIDPGPDGPFSFGASGLQITAKKNSDGKWQSGLICSVDKDGPGQKGFSQKFGYFEISAKLPKGEGTWPAFWLVGTDKSHGSVELDVFEFYGKFISGYHTVIHYWKDPGGYHNSYIVDAPSGDLTNAFHTFGVLIDESNTTFYLDRQKYLEIPTPIEFKQPMYILANLALGGGWSIKNLSSPLVMDIQYIKVYSLR